MKKYIIEVYRALVNIGIDPLLFMRSLRGIPSFVNDYYVIKKQQKESSNIFPFGFPFPCLGDRFSESGAGKGHYFHQDLLVANRIFVNKPINHVDVGSRIDGFVAHLASFRSVTVIDIRPLKSNIRNITFIQADMMTSISDALVDSCDSLSCLHAIEHFGLGRYGDTINYDGYLLGLDNLSKILKKGGKLYISAPIGPQRIEFNAHRVFSLKYLLKYFEDKFLVDYFSYVDDGGNLHENSCFTRESIAVNFGCTYGCGIFELTKI